MGTLYIGVDVGKEGAWVALDEKGNLVDRMVTPKIASSTDVDVMKQYKWIQTMLNKPYDKFHLSLEDVHAIKGTSSKSTSSFMENKGQIYALFVASAAYRTDVSIHMIKPKEWQKKVWQSYDKVYLAGKVDTKSTSLNCAKRLWPNDNFFQNEDKYSNGKYRCSVPHDGIVDSMLIAEASRLMF